VLVVHVNCVINEDEMICFAGDRFTGLLLISLASIQGAPSDDMIFKKCYADDTRNECLFYPLNWKTSWVWAQKFCSDNEGRLVSISNAKVTAYDQFIFR